MYKIAVIGGDGTGPEVVAEGIKVLNAACTKDKVKLDYTYFDFGGARYLKTGEKLPDSAIDDLKKFDAIYLGAIGILMLLREY
jgi:3-isopropylmalate dehydrogenase